MNDSMNGSAPAPSPPPPPPLGSSKPPASAESASTASGAPVPPGGAAWSEAPGLAARGFCMGVADIIPGVSGGTMALILGIYTRLVDAIKSLDLGALKLLFQGRPKAFLARLHWRFLAPLLAGLLGGALFCTHVISLPTLLMTHSAPVLGLFFGLILGSIFLLARGAGAPGWSGAAAYLGGGLFCWVLILQVPALTPQAPWFLFLCGMLAICAMILPGISGAYILLLLNKYEYVINGLFLKNGRPAGTNFIEITLPFASGALLGIIFFSRLLSWILHRFEKQTLMAMTGLLIVSLYKIFPFQEVGVAMVGGKPRTFFKGPVWPDPKRLGPLDFGLAIGLAAAGLAAVLLLESWARRRTDARSQEPISTLD